MRKEFIERVKEIDEGSYDPIDVLNSVKRLTQSINSYKTHTGYNPCLNCVRHAPKGYTYCAVVENTGWCAKDKAVMDVEECFKGEYDSTDFDYEVKTVTIEYLEDGQWNEMNRLMDDFSWKLVARA